MFFPAPSSLAINVVIVQLIKLSCHIFAFDDLTDDCESSHWEAIPFCYIQPEIWKFEIENCDKNQPALSFSNKNTENLYIIDALA